MLRLLIANPWASGVDEERLARVRAALPPGTELRLTSAPGDATELAREASGAVDALHVFGGDGTYNEVLNGIDGTTPVGFIPGGARACFRAPSAFHAIRSRRLVFWLAPRSLAASASAV